MKQWCLEHPWMTFFIVMTLLNSIHIVVRWPTSSAKKNDKDKE